MTFPNPELMAELNRDRIQRLRERGAELKLKDDPTLEYLGACYCALADLNEVHSETIEDMWKNLAQISVLEMDIEFIELCVRVGVATHERKD